MRALLKRVFLRACRALGLFVLCDRLYRRRLLILCYHGFELADEASFWPAMFMRPKRFERRLQLLRRQGRTILGLDEAVARLANGTLPEHAVAITIDDGFYSTLSILPALQRHQAPATLYVTTYYVDKALPVFNLALRYLLWKSPLPRLELRGRPWAADQVVNLGDPQERESLLRELVEYGGTRCDAAGRERLAQELGALLGVDYETLRRERLLSLLSREEIGELARAGVDVQLHTHRHRFPAEEAAARAEILENRRILEAITGKACRHFCYPSGLYQRGQWGWLAQLGVRSATTCESGFNAPDTPPLGLRRFLDSENVSEIEFQAELCGFQDLLRRLRARVQAARSGPAGGRASTAGAR